MDNVADLVRRAAATDGARAALWFRGTATTWRELDERVDAIAAGLRARDPAPGDRVAIVLGNSPDFVVAYFGVLRAGLVAVPVNPASPAPELDRVLADARPSLVIGNRPHTPLDALRVVAGPVEPTTGGEDLAVLAYSSGTAGRPRGAMLSHRALLANLEQASRIAPPALRPDDVVLLVLPLFHIYGLGSALGGVAYHGATGVLVERFDPTETLAEIRQHHVTAVVGAPPMFVAWSMLPETAESFAGVRLAVSGAAPLPRLVHATLLENTGHHIFEGYGLTETGPALATTLASEVPKPGSIGRPLPGVEMALLDDADAAVETGDPGEITVRGANLFSGYWPDGTHGPDAQGWWRTGDLAFADTDGDLFLIDRRRELILVSGFNVYPREVEDVLAAHRDIAEVAVVGVPHPYTGEAVKAVVRLRPGAAPATEEVIGYAAVRLARFKCPTVVEFVAELPHSATGKVARDRLRQPTAEAGG